MRSKIILTFIILVVLSLPLTGAICGGDKEESDLTGEPITLTVWLAYEDKRNFDDVILSYQADRPNVSFEFIEKEGATYEQDLVDAIAAKNGPDIAMLKQDWLPKHADKLVAMSESAESVEEFKEVFVDVVGNTMVIDNQIYGIPLSIDTIALYYNTEHFFNADLNLPPTDWEEFIAVVKKITKRDQYGQITRSAAALGTSNNISNSQDILYNLMIQNDTRMTSADNKSATFNTSINKASGEPYYPGTKALEFYNSFANPSKETYTWNDSMPNSVEAFARGEVSMILDYAYKRNTIYNLNPTLKFQIAPMPQIKDSQDPKTYPSFWAYCVTNNADHPNDAWHFLRYISSGSKSVKKEGAAEYYETMLDGNSVFKGQPYIAENWYKSKEPAKVDEIFRTMITNVVNGQSLQAAIDSASASVTEILQSKG